MAPRPIGQGVIDAVRSCLGLVFVKLYENFELEAA